MASAPTYCTHRELKRVFPQLDEFDQKVPIYGWTEVTTNKYAAHNSGQVTQLFVDGESLGSAQSAHTDLNVEGEWFYNATDDVLYYYSASTPLDKLMEAGELFTAMVTQFRTDASRYLDSRLDPKLPKNMWKNADGAFDYLIIRTTALIAAAFMIRTKDPTSELAKSIVEEYEQNIELLNTGKAAIGFQNTGDASKGIIRDVTYTDGKLRPVDLKGTAGGVDFDLIKVKVIDAGVFGTGTYSVWTKDANQLKNNQVITAEKITGDYQPLAWGLRVRFGGDSDSDQAAANDEWEIEVRGINEVIDAADMTGIKMTRRRGV